MAPARHRAPASGRWPRAIGAAVGWGLADQALSSGSNFLIPAVFARILSAPDFGRFAVLYSVFSFSLAIVRPFTTAPLALRHRARDCTAEGSALALSLLLAVVAAAAMGLAGLTVGANSALTWTFGATLICLIGQDAIRLTCFAGGIPRTAFFNDLAVAACTVGGLGLLWMFGSVRAVPVIVVWGLSALVGIGLGARQLKAPPLFGQARAFFRLNWPLTRTLIPEAVAVSLQSQGIIWITTLSSLELVASTRGAMQNVLGPAGVLLMAVAPQLTVAFRQAVDDLRRTDLLVVGASLLLGAAFPLFAGLMLILPNSVGRLLAGDIWPSARGLLLPSSLVWSSLACITVSFTALRFRVAPARLTALRVALAAVALLIFLVLTLPAGRNGLIAAALLSSALTMAASLVTYVVVRRRRGAQVLDWLFVEPSPRDA